MNKTYRAKVNLWIDLTAPNEYRALEAYGDIIASIRENCCDEEYTIYDTDVEYMASLDEDGKIDNPNRPTLQDIEDFWNDK